jgi:uncharacterized protein
MDEPTNAGVLRRYADAWTRDDLGKLIALYHPQVVAHYGGTSEFAGTHVGRDRFVAVLIESAARSGRQLTAIDLVLQEADHGAIFARESVMVDGARAEVARALRYRLADGLIAECWLYDHDQHLVDHSWRPAG